jgi:type VI protein secretion system component Hcp
MILVKVPNVGGSGVAIVGYESGEWFVADSFTFGIEREMRESGEKGGTEDINIGVGELQECTISKSMDSASTHLAQYAINGNSPGLVEIDVVGPSEKGRPLCYLKYKLDRCFVKSWSTSVDADDRPVEYVSFYYNRIAFAVAGTKAVFSWDNVRNTPWTNHGLKL